MQVYSFAKPFSYDELRSMREFLEVCASLKQTYILQNWPALRQVLVGEALSAHVAKLEQEVAEHFPSASTEMDAWFATRKEKGSAAAERLFSSPFQGPWPKGFGVAGLGWIYWKYSNDLLGTGVGLSDTFIKKQFGDAALKAFDRDRSWLCADIKCPYCGGLAELAAARAKPRFDEFIGASLQCASCGHRESQGLYRSGTGAALTCDCARCVGVREQSVMAARRLGASTIIAFAAEIRRMVAATIGDLEPNGPGSELSEEGRRFLAAADGNPSASLPQLLEECRGSGRSRYHPYHVRDEAWKVLPHLVADGLVTAFFDESELPADDRELVEEVVRGRETMWRHSAQDGEAKVHALSSFLVGPKSASKAHLKAWVDSADELGFERSWSVLPLTFEFAANRDRLRGLAVGEGVAFAPATVHVYAARNTPWWVRGSDELAQISRDLQAPSGFHNKGAAILEALRDQVAPAMASRYSDEYLALSSKGHAFLEEVKACVRAQVEFDRESLHTDAGKALGKYLYWSMCREAIGEAEGVPLGWIMSYFGAQKAQFSRLIEQVSVPRTCPCCSSLGDATSVRVRPPHLLESAQFHCQACGHTEGYGIAHGNRSTCPCPSCSADRERALSEARRLALGISDRMVEVASQIAEEGDEYWSSGLSDSDAKRALLSYAQLRMVGKPPDESGHIVFASTRFGGTTTQSHWPEWITPAVLESGLFAESNEQRLNGAHALRFAREALEIRLGEIALNGSRIFTLQELEDGLTGNDGKQFVLAVAVLGRALEGGFLLPRRRLCRESARTIYSLAEQANASGHEPEHIFAGDTWFRKNAKIHEFVARRVPAWE